MAQASLSNDVEALSEAIKDQVNTSLGANYTNYDGMSGALGNVIAVELDNTNTRLFDFFQKTQIGQASGEDLDRKAFELFGEYRMPSSIANASYTDSNLYFYTDESHFGAINNGQDIVIPAGTIVGADSDLNVRNTIVYQTINSYTLSSINSVGYCDVRAVNAGSAMNVAEGTLVHHDFIDYADSAQGLLKVYNLFPILNGSEAESDERFRFRLRLIYASMLENNRDSLALKALSVPGVETYRVLENYYGIGTVAVVVHGDGLETNSSLVNQVQLKLDNIKVPGTRYAAISGVKVVFDIEMRFIVSEALSEEESSRLKSLIKTLAYEELKRNEISSNVDFNSIAKFVVRNLSGQIISFVNNDNNNMLFERVLVRRTDRYTLLPEEKRELLSSNYVVEDDERIALGRLTVSFQQEV